MAKPVGRMVLAAFALAISSVICFGMEGSGSSQNRSPYSAWKNGPSPDPSYFPLAVWAQDPKLADQYRAIGINTYVGLGPTEQDLAMLRQAGMRAICDQDAVGLKHLDDPTIMGWMHGDEPDNYQEKPGGGGYVPAIPPSAIIAEYNDYRRNDPTRPVLLNLGQGVANDENKGTYAVLSDYPEYMKGADIVSFDIYPIAGTDEGGPDWLWMVPKGVDRLARWGQGKKVIWNALECTHISNPGHRPTPEQVKSEVWMSIIHGSMGIIYFCHVFKPKEVDAALLADPEMSAAVKEINQQILALAPVLNSPTIVDGGTATSDNPLVPVDVMVKQRGDSSGDAIYMLAVGMRNLPTHAHLTIDMLHRLRTSKTIEVVGENRTIPAWGGRFEDDFKPYEVHIYKAALGAGAPLQ
jgi:hypothetical protein